MSSEKTLEEIKQMQKNLAALIDKFEAEKTKEKTEEPSQSPESGIKTQEKFSNEQKAFSSNTEVVQDLSPNIEKNEGDDRIWAIIDNNPFSCEGRVGRKTFLITTVCLFIANIAVSIMFVFLINVFNIHLSESATNGWMIILSFPFILLQVFASIKRCHDLKESGAFVVLAFVPILSLYPLALWLFKPSAWKEKIK